LSDAIEKEIKNEFFSDADELTKLRELLCICIAKHEYGPKTSKDKIKLIPVNMTINDVNKLPIDKILSVGRDKKGLKS
jgi:hypothetical protein